MAINRPSKRNAFRPRTVSELCDAFARIRDDSAIGVVLLTGVGPAEDGGYAFVQAVIKVFVGMVVISMKQVWLG